MKAKINIDTLSAINKFVNICSTLKCLVHLTDGSQYTVSAKSLLGAIATTDWSEVYVVCEQDIRSHIEEFQQSKRNYKQFVNDSKNLLTNQRKYDIIYTVKTKQNDFHCNMEGQLSWLERV